MTNSKLGDFNGDKKVDIQDLNTLLKNWGKLYGINDLNNLQKLG